MNILTFVCVSNGCLERIFQRVFDSSEKVDDFTIMLKSKNVAEGYFKLSAVIRNTDGSSFLQISSEWKHYVKEREDRVAALYDAHEEEEINAADLYKEGRDVLFPAFQAAVISNGPPDRMHELIQQIRENKRAEEASRARIQSLDVEMTSLMSTDLVERTESTSVPIGQITSFIFGALGNGTQTTDAYAGIIHGVPADYDYDHHGNSSVTPLPDVDLSNIEKRPLVVEWR